MRLDDFRQQMNEWGRMKVPFLFAVDFEMKQPQIWALNEINPAEVLFNFNGRGNGVLTEPPVSTPLKIIPIPFHDFKSKFDVVMNHLQRGDSFLTNLTLKFALEEHVDLRELFFSARAPYKMWMRNLFLFFSPETFVQISNGVISTYPMKGTIDASLPNAKSITGRGHRTLHSIITACWRMDCSSIPK